MSSELIFAKWFWKFVTTINKKNCAVLQNKKTRQKTKCIPKTANKTTKRATSSAAPKFFKETVKINDKQRRALKRIKKDDLNKLAKLAEESIDKKSTSSDIDHALSRN